MVLINSINASLPRISYLKAVDYYLVASFAFIAASLVEYICVLRTPTKEECLLERTSHEEEVRSESYTTAAHFQNGR